ncbi:hypothetical protein Tco_0033671 [Tanacetum coccineum]
MGILIYGRPKETGIKYFLSSKIGTMMAPDNAIDEDMDEQPIQDLALNVDNVFQADDCDAYDSNVDEAPMAQTMFMANLSSADPVYDEVGPSYDSDVLSERYMTVIIMKNTRCTTMYNQTMLLTHMPIIRVIVI